MKKIIYPVLLVVLSGIFIVSAWQIVQIYREYQTSVDSYSSLAQYISVPESRGAENTDDIQGEPSQTENSAAEPMDAISWPSVDFDALREINPDVVAWIYIAGTNVNYPVVHGADNSYYLAHLFDGTPNSSGCIFLEQDTPGDFSAQNNVLHGHHRKNGTMFADITGYKQQDFYDSHPVALLLTPERNYKVLLFSGYVASTTDNAWDPYFYPEDYGGWLEFISSRSDFACSVHPTTADRILTLSTCSYEFEDARYVLHGILKEAQ